MRFPGLDGLLLLALDVISFAVWLLRGRPELGWPMLLAFGATLAWLLATRVARRGPEPGPLPAEPRIVVVIPVRNNARTVADVVTRCRASGLPVWLIDDGSTDGSGALAAEAGARVVTHPVNRGKGAALNTALEQAHAAGFSHVVAIDGDGQHLPEDLPLFVDQVRKRPAAIVAGVRDMSGAPGGAGWARRNSNFWVWVETGRWLGDTQSGFRAYPVEAVRALNLPPSRYEWEVEVLTRAVWAGVPVVDVGCRVYYPPAHERVSSYRKVIDTLWVTWLNAQLVTERILWPPRWVPPAPRDDWRGQHRGSLLGWRLLLLALRVVGRRGMHLAIGPLVSFYWVVNRPARAGIDAYLRRRVPEASPAARSWLALKLIAAFGASIVDRFALLVFGPDALQVDRSALDAVRPLLRESNQGVLLLSAHVGDPEIAAAALRDGSTRRVHLMMHVDPNDPYQRLMRESLGDKAPSVIALDDPEPASLAALRALRAGDVVGVKFDRVVGDRVARVPFLGEPILLPTGPLLLAALSGATTVVIGCFRDGDRYKVVASEPRVYRFTSRAERPADLQRWATELAGLLDAWTKDYPLSWYNFHDPWDTPPPADAPAEAIGEA